MENELSVYNEFQAQLAVFKAEDAELVFDIETPDGEADCRDYHKKLRKVYNRVNDLRLDTSRIYRDKVSNINTEGNGILAEIDAIANPRKKLLDDKEARLQAIIDAKAAEAEAEAAYAEDWRIAHLDNREWDIKVAEDKIKDAAAAAKKVIDDAETKRVTDEATAKAVEEATAKATFDAEQKAHKAKNDLIAQQLKEKNDAQKVIDDDAETECLRVEDKQHRETVECEIVSGLFMTLDSYGEANAVLKAIKNGIIPNLEIKY